MIRTITPEELVEADRVLTSVQADVLHRGLTTSLLQELGLRLRQASHDAYARQAVLERWEWEVFVNPHRPGDIVARPAKIGEDTINWDGKFNALAMINREAAPAFQHDCTNCTYLGQFREYDLYHCTQGGVMPTLIGRWGNEGAEYTSGPTLQAGLLVLTLEQVEGILA